MKEPNEKYKDTVFRLLYSNPTRALSLYNSINGTDYDDPSMLEYNTIENAIFMNMKNDLSFTIASQLNLYEHQSTSYVNIPLRDMLYISDILQKMIWKKSLYSSKRVKIPTPNFIVFYNGIEQRPEEEEIYLSDSYAVPVEHPALELKVRVLNINPGMNEEIKDKCPSLRDYMLYVERVRKYAETMELGKAVEMAVNECIADGIMPEFLTDQKALVTKLSIYEYDEEREMKLIRRDEREIGVEIGVELGSQKINELYSRLKNEERTEDLMRAIDDSEFRNSLLEAYSLA